MRRHLRTLLPLAALLAVTAIPTGPASAASEEVFEGSIHFDCYGCLGSAGSLDVQFLFGDGSTGTFTSQQGCFLPEVTGTMTGEKDMDFELTFAGPAFLFQGHEIGGDGRGFQGAGVVLFAGEAQCGQPVDAVITGTMVTLGAS